MDFNCIEKADEPQLSKRTLIVGASHVWGWELMVRARVMPPLSNQDVIWGVDALPLFSLEMKNQIIQQADKVDRIILFVSDFRYGNTYLNDHSAFDQPFVAGDFDELYRNTRLSFSPPRKDLISTNNDQILYQNALKVLDYLVSSYPEKIRFIFWDLNIRENINRLQKKYTTEQGYRHPVWNYDDLLARYSAHTLDVKIIRPHLSTFTYDQQGHPSFKGYHFLWHLITKEDPIKALEITQTRFDKNWHDLFRE